MVKSKKVLNHCILVRVLCGVVFSRRLSLLALVLCGIVPLKRLSFWRKSFVVLVPGGGGFCIVGHLWHRQSMQRTLLKNLTNDAIAQLYVTKCSTISLYLTKLYVTQSFAIVSSVKCSEICQTFLTVYRSYVAFFWRLHFVTLGL